MGKKCSNCGNLWSEQSFTYMDNSDERYCPVCMIFNCIGAIKDLYDKIELLHNCVDATKSASKSNITKGEIIKSCKDATNNPVTTCKKCKYFCKTGDRYYCKALMCSPEENKVFWIDKEEIENRPDWCVYKVYPEIKER